MKEMISYLYNINITDELHFDDKTIYKTENNNYLLEEVDDIKQVQILNNYLLYLNSRTFFSYKFLNTIYNEIYFIHDNKNHVLISIGNDYDSLIDIDDMFDFYNKSNLLLQNKIKYNNNWEILWENKIDYLMMHFNNNKTTNKNIYLIFNYYISMAENALLYLKKVKKIYHINDQISFTHRRVGAHNYKLSFYNPTNFIVDLKIRDISEYIKSLYYENENYLIELEYYLKTNNLDQYLASFLFARIMYPTIFFDDYESGNLDFKKFINITKYENFIKKIYDVISSYISIEQFK